MAAGNVVVTGASSGIGRACALRLDQLGFRLFAGVIVNIGSIAGRSALPYSSPYCSSKFALEGITDSLRMELRQWGIAVSIIEPGGVRTPLWEKSLADANEALSAAPAHLIELYGTMIARMRPAVAQAAKQSSPVEDVVKAVEHALTASKPKTRYLVRRDARLRIRLNHLTDRVRDTLILKKLNSIRVE